MMVFFNPLFYTVLNLDLSSSIIEMELEASLFNTPEWKFDTNRIIKDISISADGTYIAVGANQVIFFYNKSSRTQLWSYDIGFDIGTIDLSSDGKYLAVGGENAHLFMFNTFNDTSPLLWDRTYGGYIVKISSDGQFLATTRLVNIYNRIYFYNTSDSVALWSYTWTTFGSGLDVSANGSFILAGCGDNVYLFDKSGNTPYWSFNTGDSIQCISFSSDGNYFVVGNSYVGDDLFLFNFTNKFSPSLLWSSNIGGAVTLDISWDGSYITIGCANDRLYLFHKTSSEPLWYKVFDTFIREVAISSDGSFITTVTGEMLHPDQVDISLYLFSKQSSTQLWKYKPLNYWFTNVAISSKGDHIVVGGHDEWVYYFYCPYTPFPFTLTSNAGNPDDDGNFDLLLNDAVAADNFTLYYSDSFITEINENCTMIAEGIVSQFYTILGLRNGDYYYIVEAINRYGTHLSTCIQISVRHPPGLFTLDIDADVPDMDGIVFLNWTESSNADNYSIYLYNHPIFEINESITLLKSNITALNFTLTLWKGLHYIVVVAYNGSGSTLSNNVFVDVQVPPKSFELTTNTDEIDKDGNFYLIWNKSKGADNYTVFVLDKEITEINETLSSLINNTIEVSFHVSGLESDDYYFIVVAFNQYGQSLSNCIHVSVQISPYSFTLTTDADPIDTDGVFNLTWDVSLYADNYSIYMYDKLITEVNSSIGILEEGFKFLTYPISGLSDGDYYYVVVAYNEFGNISSNCIKVLVRLAPGAFTLNSTPDIPDSDGVFDLTWTVSLRADNYSVYMYNHYISEINSSLTILAKEVLQYDYHISDLSNNRYYFIIVAHNTYANTTSNCITVIIGKPPGSFSFYIEADIPDRDGEIDLSWDTSEEAKNYSIYAFNKPITEINGSLTVIASGITSLSYHVSGLSNGDHYFIVVAYNEYGERLSSSIHVRVQLPTDREIPFGDFYLIIFFVTCTCLVLIKKRRSI